MAWNIERREPRRPRADSENTIEVLGTDQRSGYFLRRHALRTVFAGLAAAVGAAVIGTSRSKEAMAVPYTYTSTDPVATLEADNTGTGIGLYGTTGGGSATAGVVGFSSGYGVVGLGQVAGIVGVTSVTSVTSVASVNGVIGHNTVGGVAVYGASTSGTNNNSIGVSGVSASSSGGIGVFGVSSNDISGIGVYAISLTGTGFYGYSGAAGGVGAAGLNTTAGIGLYGQSNGGFAGVFSGNVYVTGSLTVLGAKSAAVRGADGSLKRLYSIESPESWFEDFGSGQLSGGTATVPIDPGFAALVDGEGYRVFLTADAETEMLYVTGKTPASFVVREGHGGTSDVSFDYRVVARRKDIAGVRLEHVDEPRLPAVAPPPPQAQIPSPPAAPLKPMRPSPHLP